MNTATLANSGVKVDTTYGVNGYINNTQVNATENAVAVSVKLIPYSAEFAFNDENGQQSEEQFKVYTLYVKVDKASIDFSKVVWSADELEYSAFGNGVEVVSGIPSFLNITYNDGSKGLAVGEYKAQVRSLQIKPNAKDMATAANYNVPSLDEVRASEYLKHDWKIVKKRINVIWIPGEVSAESNILWIPYIADNSTNVIEYTYYLDSDEDMENAMSLDDIMDAYDATKTVDYVVCARVNNDNFVLYESGKEKEYSLSAFQVGDNKIPVRVNLKTDSVVYNGTKQEAEVEVDAGGIKINVIITYFVKEGDTFVPLTDPDQPMDAAEYKVRVALTPDISESMAISGQREFLYTIEKAEIDLSGLKWVDAANGDEEYTEPYVYKPGVTHELTLSGVDAISELGLTVTYKEETQANRTGTNAGEYKVVITFTESEFFESNYKVPDDIEFTWQILPYTPDLSGVTWNYNADPFIFKIKDGEPVKQSARLIGFPEGYEEELASMIVYGDDDGEYSDVSTHRTSYSVNEDHEKRSNYGAFLFPSGLETAIDWEIHPLK
ncbi:MAG: hypothetical protein K2M36_01410, partial [Clostridia bacterium]|nr:hypothetical protein [Clostridia bacterium]